MDALTSFIKCFVSSDAINRRILLQPVLLYLNRYNTSGKFHLYFGILLATIFFVPSRNFYWQFYFLFVSIRALSYISQVVENERSGTKPLMDLFIIRVLLTYQALSDPSLYKSDHGHIIQICTTPFRYFNWLISILRFPFFVLSCWHFASFYKFCLHHRFYCFLN